MRIHVVFCHATAVLWLVSFGCTGGATLTVTDGSPETADTVGQEQELATADVPVDLPGLADQHPEAWGDTASDLLPEDARGCSPGEGCFLDPCEDNGDCLAGVCVEHLGNKVCSQACVEECPDGWKCEPFDAGGPDLTYVCLSPYTTLCKPCNATADCKSEAGTQDACIDYGPQGRFCGADCSQGPCPMGYVCKDALTAEGVGVKQCMAEQGVCACSSQAKALGLSTPCYVENELGKCTGKRACVAEGLEPCSAPEPAEEICNGLDDDCDGTTDAGLCDDSNPCTADKCDPKSGCVNTPLSGVDCNDGNVCTLADHCEAGQCLGTLINCDDGNPCTTDTCAPTGGCTYGFNNASCDDGDPCTAADACQLGKCVGVALPCDCQKDSDCGALEDGNVCNGTLVCDKSKIPNQCVVNPGTVITCPGPVGVNAACLKPTCHPKSGDCSFEPANNGLFCEDGNACTAGSTCQAGTCSGGTQVNCNDGNPCTDDLCDPATGCAHNPNAVPCSDGNACTTGDVCGGGGCVAPGFLDCDDGNPCTDDSCNPATGCIHKPNAVPCSDGNACTTGDVCTGGACAGKGILACNDGNVCTDDSCDPAKGCQYVTNALPCSDGDACTMGDACSQGACKGGPAVDCNDGNVCTDDSCDAKKGCLHLPNAAACTDNNACTTGDQCKGGACMPSGPQPCDDSNLCTTDSCDPKLGCVFGLNAAPCDDGNLCTTGDKCDGGACKGGPALACNDGNVCTDDSCDKAKGCVHSPNTAACNDGSLCSVGDTCKGGWCAGKPVSCDDGNPCTDDSCEPDKGCVHSPNTAACNDGNACTLVDVCAAGKCAGSNDLSCSDGNVCTDDACDPKAGCTHTPNMGGCSDSNACTTNDVCAAGSCKGGPVQVCNDGNLCTDDSCEPATGCKYVNNTVPCNDGNACTLSDVCDSGTCKGGPALPCNDGDACTTDSCSQQTGCVYTPVVPCCGNGVKEAGEGCDKNDAAACPGSCQADCTCKSIHNTVSFVPTSTAGGCSYSNSHAIKWLNLGNTTWKQCAVEASKRGAMMAPEDYTVAVGWCSHRKGNNAMTGKWSSYQQADIGSQQPCILARDPHATINNAPLNQSVSYDGMVWHYQDYGTKYYDECQTLAGNAGAMIITPYTIGQSGDNYWVNSVHMCNTYEWIISSGTNFSYDNLGAYSRSSQRSCMVGYVD
ncbi:MAG: hypothetical protein FJ109_13855 [Deltaproteobacteria bacterium]|nr:hypothetical protein [Deltaproteobacteria bacterium]